MSNTSSSSSTGGISLVTALTVIFVLLKVFNKISWSWWLVFSPVWISMILSIIFLFIIGAVIWRIDK